jgi:hypothetical protein
MQDRLGNKSDSSQAMHWMMALLALLTSSNKIVRNDEIM